VKSSVFPAQGHFSGGFDSRQLHRETSQAERFGLFSLRTGRGPKALACFLFLINIGRLSPLQETWHSDTASRAEHRRDHDRATRIIASSRRRSNSYRGF
jgi:hypothetical protein